ncbi:hypothetical protein VNI00_016739 [Paramarasmius palmivorus]|uniref:Uncharacterized protein n=1 Tax=Paramarasmius palmivorus TaxID=297713 RepID=A0AAW0BAZ4_9AGAR
MAKKRKTQTTSNAERNARSWPKGEKLKMLESHEELFHKDRSAMYSHATEEFVQTWGYDLPPDVIPEPGVDYKPEDINTFPEGLLRGEEMKRRNNYKRKLRKRIINWANYHFRLKHVKSDEKLVSMVSKTIRDLREEVPQKKTDLQRYQELHYQGRVTPVEAPSTHQPLAQPKA